MSSSIGPPGDEDARGGIVNLLFKHDPSESFSWYVNYDYSWRDGDYDGFEGATGHGISVAGRYAITERMGASLRAEYVTTDEGFLLEREVNLWGLTGTIDYALTEQLTVKAELRWDQGSIRRAPDDLYLSNHSGLLVDEDDQAVVGVEAIYRF